MTISEETLEEFESAVWHKQSRVGKSISKSLCGEEALLMFIKKYGVKK